jgi:TRAP transporter 4TM/12TM fusion protein
VEAIASTGGQLMPPVMGIAAFVMAEILQIPYGRIALAGLIPALGYYAALFMLVDLHARRSRAGTLRREDLAAVPAILPRLHLLAPPIVLVGLLVVGYSATYAAVIATASCLVVCYVRRENWLRLRGFLAATEETAKQAAQVAVPIAAIGIIIAVAIQSNLAIKFSTGLIAASGGSLIGALLMIIVGCIIMGMGLPTVAAYIIGAILFVPALRKLGIYELGAHFFVMYYCVLSMVTPPVALASYAAAGLAEANPMRTGLIAFRMSLVTFLVPFAFAFDKALLAEGSVVTISLGLVSLMVGTATWSAAMEGFLGRPLGPLLRLLFGAAALNIILSPTGTLTWGIGLGAVAVLATWTFLVRPQPRPAVRAAGQGDA